MSQAVRGAVVVLILLLVVSVGVAVFALMQKQSLEQQNQGLQTQLSEYQTKETEFLAKAKKLEQSSKDLNDRIAKQDQEKKQAQQSLDEIKSKADDLSSQLAQMTSDRDSWKGRLDTIRQERDSLVDKLKNQPEKIVYKESEAKAPVETAPVVTAPQGDEYWASVLKERAALQLEIEKVKGDLDQTVLQLADLKKVNSDLQLQVTQLSNEKEEISRKIKYGEDLANNLSIELARSRNDQKFVNDRADKMKEENLELQGQIKGLTATKVSLEKTVSRLNNDRASTEKKLTETENVIQGRIDEIWQIKQSLDRKISDLPAKNGEVELPPIIVNAQGQGGMATTKSQGTIISINETNNFVIVDLGESDHSQVGKTLKVYRGNNAIATLEVIQVRKDISAADIKQKSTQLKVGDIVR